MMGDFTVEQILEVYKTSNSKCEDVILYDLTCKNK
jgi:hypothetical protein